MNLPATKRRPVVHTIPQEEVDKFYVPIDDQLQVAKTELIRRRKTYPTKVSNGRMTFSVATYQIAAQQAIVKTLKEVFEKEQKERNWF